MSVLLKMINTAEVQHCFSDKIIQKIKTVYTNCSFSTTFVQNFCFNAVQIIDSVSCDAEIISMLQQILFMFHVCRRPDNLYLSVGDYESLFKWSWVS